MRRAVLLAATTAGLVVLAARPAAAASPPAVAVLYFDYDGKKEDLAVLKKGLAQMLISDLTAVEGCRLVERSRLEAVLDEQKLGQSGKIDRSTAARIGQLLGARMMVVGGFFDLGGALRVDARLVDVETGRILGAVGVTGKNDDFLGVEQRLAGDLEKLVARELEAARSATPAAARSPSRARPKAPARLKTGTAVTYSQALAAADKGDRTTARARLQVVLADQPDFQLARADLERLMQ